MEIINTTNPVEFEDYANECLNGHEGIVIHICEEPCVWTGLLQDTYNKEECEKRGLAVCIGQYYAGTIVNMKGDVSVCACTWGKTDIGENICEAIADMLRERGVEVTHDVNDILANEKKVASWASVPQSSGWVQTVVHLSVGKMDLKLVKAICTKPMIKTPGTLSNFGITTDDVLNIVDDILKKIFN